MYEDGMTYANGFGKSGSLDCVDVGTTGVRAIAYTEEGTNVCSSEAFYPLLTPHPDWAEESPLQIYEAIEQVVRKTADQLRYKNKELAGVA